MKKLLAVLVLTVALLYGVSYLWVRGERSQIGDHITLKEWIDQKGEVDECTLTVTLTELQNPFCARVKDYSGSALLLGLWENGMPISFEEKGIGIGDTFMIKNPAYCLYDENVELLHAVLAEKE